MKYIADFIQKIIAIAWKDTKIRFTSWAEWLFFLILPIVFTVVMAGSTGGSGDTRVILAVVDQANSPLSAELVNALSQSEAVRPELYTLTKAEGEFSQRHISVMLVIPPQFDLEHLKQGKIDLELRQLPNNMNALAASRAVAAVISRVGSVVNIASASVAEAESIRAFETDAVRQAYFDTALVEAQAQMSAAPQRVRDTEGATQDPIQYDPRANSSAGQLVTWVFIPLIGISAMFAYEREKGTLRRLLITPTPKATYLLGTILGQVASALVQVFLLLIFGAVVMQIKWGQSPLALAVLMFAATLAAAALGTALGTFVKSEAQANGLSIMMGMVMALLGGCWYPIELFPQVVRSAVQVLPTTWAMKGMLDIALRGAGLPAVLPTAGVLLAFAVVFFIIGILRFRYE
jgi:ABC-2 type transport system permease protein